MKEWSFVYIAMIIGCFFDWATAIACYCLINHWLGWFLLAMAFLADISRGLRLKKLDKMSSIWSI